MQLTLLCSMPFFRMDCLSPLRTFLRLIVPLPSAAVFVELAELIAEIISCTQGIKLNGTAVFAGS